MIRKATGKFYLCTLLLTTVLVIGRVNSDDACYDIIDGSLGFGAGNCIPSSACASGQVVPRACSSFPDDHVCCLSETFPEREARGAWIATVSNIDWPLSPNENVTTQQSALEGLIDTLHAAGINEIYFQVRPAGDALYNPSIEPWSRYLTGVQGRPPSPAWDPLAHVVDYAHSKNMDVHAWINPYRASLFPTFDGLAANHMAKLYPQYAYAYSTYLWMDPGAEVVQNRTFDVVMDLVTRYDIDGIHMDDYFYPYPVAGLSFPDNTTYAEYVSSSGNASLSLDDWRRQNVNKLIQRIYGGIHNSSSKPWVRLSISPFGIYRPCEIDVGMPCSIAGFDQYSGIYCDARLWLQQGWVDILQPQLYWKIDPPAQSYPVLLNWWTEQNIKHRHIYAGNYLSRVLDGWPLSELTNQIQISRNSSFRAKGSWGNGQFSAKIFRDVQNAVSHFRETVYQYPALLPTFPWLAQGQPKPRLPQVNVGPDGIVSLSMSEADRNYTGGSAASLHKLVLHRRSSNQLWELYKVIRLPQDDERREDFRIQFRPLSGDYILHAEDRYGQESEKMFFKIN